jgi:hypothetical protein
VAWNGTKPCDEGNSEATLSDDPGQAAILHIRPFKLFSARTTTILEGTSRRHINIDILLSAYTSKVADHALEIAQLSEK